MAEYAENEIQLVQPNQNVLLKTIIPCCKGCVYHRDGSGILTLRGAVNGGYVTRYKVTFNANIAVPTDGTVGPIAVAIALDGEPIQTSRSIVTPAAVEEYFNVTSTAVIAVPRGCCMNLSVENVTPGATAAAAPTAINVQNASLTVTRSA